MRKIVTLCIVIFLLAASNLLADNVKRIIEKNTDYNKRQLYGITMNPVNNKYYALGWINSTKQAGKRYLYLSEDFGKTWNPRNEVASEFIRIYFDSKGNLFLSGDNCIAISKDDGYSYKNVFCIDGIDNGYYPNLTDCKFNSKDEIFITVDFLYRYGNRSDTISTIIYTSKNCGQTWDTINTNITINQFIIDSNDDIFVISTAKRLFQSVVLHGDYDDYLLAAKNAFYKFNKTSNQFDLITQSNNDSLDCGVYESIAVNNNNIYLLFGKEKSILISFGPNIYYYDYIADIQFLSYNKNNNLIDTISRNKDDNLKIFNSYSKFDMIFNDSNEILIYTGSDIYKSNTTLDRFNHSYSSSGYYNYPKFTKLSNGNISFSNNNFGLLSTDNGSNWRIVDYYNLNHLPYKNGYITKDSTFICLDTNNRLFSTTNNGLTWFNLTTNISPTQRITSICQTNNWNYVVGTESDGVLYRRNDGTWEKRNNKLSSLSINNIRESKSGEIYVCTNNGLYSTNDECQTYNLIYMVPAKDVLVKDYALYLTTNDGKLFIIRMSDGVIIDVVRALNDYFISSIAINNQDVAIASTINKGVFRSTDLGRTWNPANNEFVSPIVYQVISTKDDEFIARAQTGIFYTNNNGDIWEKNNYGYAYDYDDNPSAINKDHIFKFVPLNYGNILLVSPRVSFFIDSTDKSPIEEASGWVDNASYLVNRLCGQNDKPDNMNNFFNFSENGKYLNTLGSNSSNEIFFKIDYSTGKCIEEIFIPSLYPFQVYGYNESGVLLFLAHKKSGKNNTLNIVRYDVYSTKNITEISIKYNQLSESNMFRIIDDTKNKRIIVFESYIDSSKAYLEQNGFSKIRIVDYNGNIIDEQQRNYITLLSCSNDKSQFIFKEEIITKDTSHANGYKKIIDTKLILFDIAKNIFYEIDTTSLVAYKDYRANFIFTDDMTKIIYSNQNYNDSILTIFNLENITPGTMIKKSKTINFKYYTWSLLNNSEILFYSSKLDEAFYIYNIDNNLLKFKSPKIYFDSNILMSPDKKSFVNENCCFKYVIDSLVNQSHYEFYSNVTTANINDTVHFYSLNNSLAKNIIWDFGDGTFSYGDTALHVYKHSGLFDVSVHCINNNKPDSIIKTGYIHIILPSIDFTASKTYCELKDTVWFSASGSPDVKSFKWNFGDGDTASGENVAHKFRYSSFFTVSLSYSNFIDSGKVIKSKYIQVVLKSNIDEELKNNSNLSISPNPVSQTTEIQYQTIDNCNVKLSLVSLLGQEIAVLKDGFEEVGDHNYELPISNYNLHDGVYFVRLVAGDRVQTVKVIILK